MKAYMSNRDERLDRIAVWNAYANESCESELVELACDQAAEREVRAILAETEPESRCPEAVTARYGLDTLARSVRHPGIAFTLPHDIQAALADALRAFIES